MVFMQSQFPPVSMWCGSFLQMWSIWLEMIKMTCKGQSPSAWKSPTGHSGRRVSLMRSKPSAGGLNSMTDSKQTRREILSSSSDWSAVSLWWISTLTAYMVSIFGHVVMKISLAYTFTVPCRICQVYWEKNPQDICCNIKHIGSRNWPISQI